MNRIIYDDCRAAMPRLIEEGVQIDSIVTDPPYHLESVVKRFGKEGSAPAQFGSDGRFSRQSKGFMGQKWDGSDKSGLRIAFDPATWRLAWKLLRPGGYIAAFSSSRTYHRMACAIEDAGFITHPMIGWAYGQGFPKAHDAERAIALSTCPVPGRHFANSLPEPGKRLPGDHVCPPTPESQEWDGWYYGGQAMKPALEPIYFGQKPFSEKNGALNILEHGTGAINIDGCRVETVGELNPSIARRKGSVNHLSDRPAAETEAEGRMVSRQSPEAFRSARVGELKGRWSANLIHDGSDQVVACFPNQVSGGTPARRGPDGERNTYGEFKGGPAGNGVGSTSGSAARFFNSFPFGDDDRPFLYHPKATKADRAGSQHPTVKPVGLKRWLCRLVTPPGGLILDLFAGSGTTGAAAHAEGFRTLLIEREREYVADMRRRFGLSDPLAEPEIRALLGDYPEMDLV